MKIAVVGTGYVGLTTGACLAYLGHDVTCVDIDVDRVNTLKQGHVPIHEPGLQDIVQSAEADGRLRFTTQMAEAIAHTHVVFIGVGTPSDEQGNANLQYVFKAVEDIATHARDYMVIVTKSTVPVGTGQRVLDHARTVNSGVQFDVVSNPEFLREGSAVHDFMHPDRIVVGVESERAKGVMAEVYMPLTSKAYSLEITDLASAEIIKYASNAFLATKISFINQIADLCEKTGGNVMNVARGLGMDNRIGDKFLHPGPGYGGSCFPKDTMALLQTVRAHHGDMSIVASVVEYNRTRQYAMAKKVVNAFNIYTGGVQGKTIAVLGVAFKGNTDDMRSSPALTIIPELQKHGLSICAYDPQAMDNAKPLLPHIAWADDIQSCVAGADGVLILTEWQQFAQLDLPQLSQSLKTPLFVDLRNLYRKKDLQDTGIIYVSLGRQDVVPPSSETAHDEVQA